MCYEVGVLWPGPVAALPDLKWKPTCKYGLTSMVDQD